jgi:flagellar motor protein MotB
MKNDLKYLTQIASGEFELNKTSTISPDTTKEIYARLDEDTPESFKMGASGNLSSHIMTPFADLMTLLLIFFVFFFAKSDYAKTQRIIEQNEAIINKALLDSLIQRNEQVIRIPGELLFDTGKADIKLNFYTTLDAIAEEIKEKINNEPGWQIRVEGHTDNIPIFGGKYASNWELSVARALSVVKYFMDREYFPPEQLQAMGYGKFKPLVDNSTPENRKLNRRVEIRLSRYFHKG